MALIKHGPENVILDTLFESEDWHLLCAYEKDYIKHYDTKRRKGYNRTDGGEGVTGYTITEEHRQKLRTKMKGNKFAVDCKHTPEGLARMSAASKGRVPPLEERAKVACYAAVRWAAAPYSRIDSREVVAPVPRVPGTLWTAEQKKKTSDRMLGNKQATGCVHTEDGLRRMREAQLGNKRAAGCKRTLAGKARQAAAISLGHALRAGRPVSILENYRALYPDFPSNS